MNLINRIFERIFPPVTKIPAGVYHYQAPPEADFPYRLHLRMDPEGSATLILNASTVLHLNQTAAEYAYHIIKLTPPETVAREISNRYPISAKKALADYEDFKERLDTMISTPDLDPETYLGLDRDQPYTSLTAPYRLECALTYRVSEENGKHLAPVERVRRELITEEWQTILQKAWDAGIPHVIFTGGEPTLRPDLADLIHFAEELGMVTGLLTDGLRLTEKDYLHSLLRNGLDHMMILLNPHDEQSWEAVKDSIAEDIFVTVHLTISHSNRDQIQKSFQKLAEIGVKTLSLTVDTPDLEEAMSGFRQSAAQLGLTLVWDLPVPFSSFNPVGLELGEAQENAQGAGKAWLYVEPDGDVLPAQGADRVLGNLLTDAWDQVWSAPQEG
jgi:organic radical activating enzyme